MSAYRRATVLVLILLVAYVAASFGQVWWASTQDAARPAEAIVVLGAAQYNGRPSPVFAARLDHAVTLYQADLAPVIVVTGGEGFVGEETEARVADRYLQDRGIPAEALLLETHGRSTWESLRAARRFLADRGIDEVLLVSDPWHSFRMTQTAAEVGFTAHASPTPSSPYSTAASLRQMARETVAVGLGRVIGYRRVSNLGQTIG
jgi:uncharacterized SAM-binding protein YcdF (DUF218 family)